MMKRKKILAISLFLFFLSSILIAHSSDDKRKNERRIRENIRTLMLLRMTQALDLTEEQAVKIFPTVNRIEKEKMKIQRQVGKEMKALKMILKEEKPDAQKMEEKVNRLKELRNLLKREDEELEKFLEDNLTLIQRARYILFSVDFYRGLREKLQRARMMQERLQRKERRKF